MVQALFVVVLLTFFAAEQARSLLDRGQRFAGAPAAVRAATGAAASVAFRR
ncbi:hypothetical protein [Flaviaesturariibacter aridisoli]|uniref:hypothetical protein n=1 Tax=Flaviaesturariibacter aridisoli TaxID=2545761 RepID=UPI0014043776|nr:hypothetical protein [Flaviaesturariibacter aridisoli]